ncbi:MAG: hypothetical protein ABIH41_00605 [Nanoarchaeota archaeon]
MAYYIPNFLPSYYQSIDKYGGGKEYFTPAGPAPGSVSLTPQQHEDARLQEPILPMSQIGQTVVERDPRGMHILQNITTAIRSGAGNIQLVLNTSSQQAIGGRAKAYGKEIRQVIKEMTQAAGVQIDGFEMPTASITNMSGFDMQRGSISEDKRYEDIKEVKDAIRFAVDVAGGGGVDIWSQEFSRTIDDAPWNKGAKFEAYDTEKQYGTKYLVDDRTGQLISAIRKSSIIREPEWNVFKESGMDEHGVAYQVGDYMDNAGNKIVIDPKDPTEALIRRVPAWDSDTQSFKTRRLSWDDLVKEAEERNRLTGLDLTPEGWAYRLQMETRLTQSRGQSLYYSRAYEQEMKEYQALRDALKAFKEIENNPNIPEETKRGMMQKEAIVRGYSRTDQFIQNVGEYKMPSQLIEERIKDLEHNFKHIHEGSSAADAQAAQIVDDLEHVKTLGDYALKKSVDSYAELALFALNEQENNPNAKKDIHVGPELGWPGAYGGHPEEFKELILKSRERMVELMTEKRVKDQFGMEVDNQAYRSDLGKGEAEELAKKHIKGMFDTSHLGMWLNHFKREHPHESEDHRRVRFNKWYLQQVDSLADPELDLIGGVQAVDSASGAHGHLPPGQGIFPVVEAVKLMKQKGWQGYLVSEGHEEEQFGTGRILHETWRAFGSNIHSGLWTPHQPMVTFGQAYHGSYGYGAPPNYIVGAYSPSNEWKVWSEVPFE